MLLISPTILIGCLDIWGFTNDIARSRILRGSRLISKFVLFALPTAALRRDRLGDALL
jgi:hypothetical protein